MRQRRVTCPSGQAAAVACDRITAISVAAVTALTAVRPKGAILWTEQRQTIRSRPPEPHTLLWDFDDKTEPLPHKDAETWVGHSGNTFYNGIKVAMKPLQIIVWLH